MGCQCFAVSHALLCSSPACMLNCVSGGTSSCLVSRTASLSHPCPPPPPRPPPTSCHPLCLQLLASFPTAPLFPLASPPLLQLQLQHVEAASASSAPSTAAPPSSSSSSFRQQAAGEAAAKPSTSQGALLVACLRMHQTARPSYYNRVYPHLVLAPHPVTLRSLSPSVMSSALLPSAPTTLAASPHPHSPSTPLLSSSLVRCIPHLPHTPAAARLCCGPHLPFALRPTGHRPHGSAEAQPAVDK